MQMITSDVEEVMMKLPKRTKVVGHKILKKGWSNLEDLRKNVKSCETTSVVGGTGKKLGD